MVLKEFTSKQAARLIGIPLRTLQSWDEGDFLRPSIKGTGGKRRWRRWGFRDLVAGRAAAKLRKAGVSLQKLRKVLKNIERLGYELEQPLGETVLLVLGSDVLLLDRQKALSVLSDPGQFALVEGMLDLSETVGEVRRDVERLSKAI